MKRASVSLITCGTPGPDLQAVQQLLHAAGLAPALPATTGSIGSIGTWHDRLFAGQPESLGTIEPGRPWELAASEIFLANWEQAAWGWADHRSTWLLDFWRDFDPSTRFVLLHTPAQDLLSQAMAAFGDIPFDGQQLLDNWCTYQTELLSFYHRNRSRCVLCHAHIALHHSAAWLANLNQSLGTELSPVSINSSNGQQREHGLDPLTQLVVHTLLQDQPQVLALEAEIRATLTDDAQPSAALLPDITAASHHLRTLHAVHADLRQRAHQLESALRAQIDHSELAQSHAAQFEQTLQLQQSQVATLQQDNAALTLQMAHLTTTLRTETKAKSEAIAQRDAEHQARQDAITQHLNATQRHEKARQALQQEKELLAAQLRTAQDELEQQFLTAESLTSARDANAKARTEALTQRDAESKAKTEALTQLSAESKAKSDLSAKLDTLQKDHSQLSAAHAALTAAHTALAQEKATQQAQHATATQQQEKARQELQQESELLLLQLHQVQEELEQYFLQHQQASQDKEKLAAQLATAQTTATQLQAEIGQLSTARDTLTKEKAALTAARDAEAKAKTEALSQRDTESKAKTEALTQRDNESAAKATAISQRDAESKAKSDLSTKLDALQKDHAQLNSARDTLTKEKAALTAAHATQQAQHATATRQQETARQELQQESELLLLQLHQVQEELEHYFLQHQQVTQEKQTLSTRLDKLLARFPDFAEYDRIDIITNEAATPTQLHCHIHGLKAAGRSAALLDLTLDVTGKRPLLLLAPPVAPAASPLLYWPASPAEDGTLSALQLDPSAPANSPPASILRNCTQSDLHLLRAACGALAEGLPATLPGRAPWVQHLTTLRQQFAALAPAWRFDTVQLKHQQINPDYEHLWFALTNASFGSRQWPTFEFRLGAANIKRGKFSQHPKLEFPLPAQGEKQFENWFEESEDDRGPKYELRFDTKNKGLDLNAWQALSPTDQAQALSLCAQLPALLQRLQTQDSKIARPWTDWQAMAIALQQALAHNLRAPAKQAVAA